MSKLPITQFCGLAGKLGDEAGSIRAGQCSKWFHANSAGQVEEASRLWLGMTEEEQEEVSQWLRPANCTLDSNLLRYEDAEKELEVQLEFELPAKQISEVEQAIEYMSGNASSLRPPTPKEAGARLVSLGHLDMAWVRNVNIGKRAYIGDIKRSRHTAKEGTNSLQLHAYGFSYSMARGCSSYRVGIWQAIEGTWIWGESAVDLESSTAADIYARIRGAALNLSLEANKGPHCQQCWGRMKCPAYLLPAALESTALAPLAEGGVGMTPDNAAKLLQRAEAMADLSGAVIAAAKAFVAQGNRIIDAESGMEYKPIQVPGRESVKVSDVKAKFGDAAKSIISKGKGYERWTWVKGPQRGG